MEVCAAEAPVAALCDLTDDTLIGIFLALDLESLVTFGKAAKRLNKVLHNDLLWMDLCRPWAASVDLRSWRARTNSGQALYRVLRSLSKLVGLWTHRSHNPRGELLYITWSTCGLEGRQVIPPTVEGDEVGFVKVFDVFSQPDGSNKLKAVFTAAASGQQLRDGERLSAGLVLQSQDEFVLESYHCSGTELAGNSNEVPLGLAKGQSLGVSSPTVSGAEDWRKLYRRLKIGEPTPSQELIGLWTGLYSPYGWEIVAISYSDDGFIVGTKVIGDPNVPSGEITFQGCLGVSVEFSDSNHFGNPLRLDQCIRLSKMYRGIGRIAIENFLSPSWVKGVLLQEQSGNFCFVWEYNNYRIRFRRVDLPSSFSSRSID